METPGSKDMQDALWAESYPEATWILLSLVRPGFVILHKCLKWVQVKQERRDAGVDLAVKKTPGQTTSKPTQGCEQPFNNC